MREAKQRIDSDEFADWLAEYLIEPWGEDWRQTAVLQATILNVNSKKRVRVEQCMPGRLARRQQSVEEMQSRLDLFFKTLMKRQERKANRGNERQ